MRDVERLLADALADERRALPVPAGAVERLRARVRRRRAARRAAATGVAASVVAVGVVLGVQGREELRTTVPAAPVAASPQASPGVVRGVARRPDGGPAAHVAVLPADASRVLTRTRADGSFEVPCVGGLLLASYAPAPVGVEPPERSPGVVNLGWRRVVATCGGVVDVTLSPGAVVVGTAPQGAEVVRLVRVRSGATTPSALSLAFATRVGPDGGFRVEGLDTGRYVLDGTERFVDAGAGRVSRLP